MANDATPAEYRRQIAAAQEQLDRFEAGERMTTLNGKDNTATHVEIYQEIKRLYERLLEMHPNA